MHGEDLCVNVFVVGKIPFGWELVGHVMALFSWSTTYFCERLYPRCVKKRLSLSGKNRRH